MARASVLPVRYPDARILIFAKAPEPGRAKTRLIPAMGAEGAARLHARLLADTVARLARPALWQVELWCAPNWTRAPFPELAARYDLECHRQRGVDLGERMRHGAAAALRRGGAAILVGTDCPLLDRAYVARALSALAGRDAVLGPAEDGGYVLLGLKRVVGALFERMPWGSDQVAAITCDRMRALGWSWAELPTLWDVDRPEDLVRLASCGGGASAVPTDTCG